MLVLTGAGRGFCAGRISATARVAPGQAVDLGESVERRYNPLIRKLVALPFPVIARVNGVVAAGPREHRARLRHRHRRPIAKFIRPSPRSDLSPTARHLGAAAARRQARALGLALTADPLAGAAGGGLGLI